MRVMAAVLAFNDTRRKGSLERPLKASLRHLTIQLVLQK